MKAFIALALLFLSVLSSYAAGNVKLYSNLEFSDNSVQDKAVSLPLCSTGEVMVNNSGSWYCGKIKIDNVNHAIIICTAGSVCAVNSCMDSYADCDGISSTGCEVDTANDKLNCGACGNKCFSQNECSVPKCMLGACDTVNVRTGFPCTGGTCDGAGVCVPAPIVCGDGIVEAGELCDDGNTTNGDGCSNTCQIETGFLCTGSKSDCTPICGDGIIRGTEQCDDNNTTSGDGCTSTCQIETAFTCLGQPSACFLNGCIATPCFPAPGPTCFNGNLTTTALACTPTGNGTRTCSYPQTTVPCLSGLCEGDVCKP